MKVGAVSDLLTLTLCNILCAVTKAWQRSCGKVMFSQVSIILFGVRGRDGRSQVPSGGSWVPSEMRVTYTGGGKGILGKGVNDGEG